MKQEKSRGFGLLEVLIALAIFGVLIGGLMSIIRQENILVKTSADLLRARLIANETMETLKVRPFEELQSYSFTEMSKLGNMIIDVQVSDFGSPSLKQVIVTVQWIDARNHEQNVALARLRSEYLLSKR